MRPPSPIQSPRFGRTAAIAAAILASVAVFQLGAVTVAFLRKSSRGLAENGDEVPHPPPLRIDVSRLVAESPPPENPGALLVDPLLPPHEERPPGPRPLLPHAEPLPLPAETAEPPSGPPPRPTPVPLSVFTPKPDPRYGELVEEGKLLRNSGDTAAALVKFREAVNIEQGNPLAIAETAFTFEKMSLPDKAAEQWKRIFVMGERAGVFYAMARAKLESAVQDTMRTVGGSTGPANGKVLSIGPLALADDPDPAAAKRFTLTVPIRARPGEDVAVNEMKVFVLFYERVNGKDIAKTIAEVGNRWTSAPVDWKDGDTETLEVSYELAAQQARAGHREYHGYIVRLYYRGDLQDTKAEPVSLGQKFPAPLTISE